MVPTRALENRGPEEFTLRTASGGKNNPQSKKHLRLKVALQRNVMLEDERARQDDAVEELSRAGIEDIFKELALSVLYGNYPLTHGVWHRLLDMLANM